VREHEAEVCRLQTTQDQLSQAKELREQHNAFLDEELMAILSALLEEQHNNAEIVADLHSKLAKVLEMLRFWVILIYWHDLVLAVVDSSMVGVG
jgi:hypothetical protein